MENTSTKTAINSQPISTKKLSVEKQIAEAIQSLDEESSHYNLAYAEDLFKSLINTKVKAEAELGLMLCKLMVILKWTETNEKPTDTKTAISIIEKLLKIKNNINQYKAYHHQIKKILFIKIGELYQAGLYAGKKDLVSADINQAYDEFDVAAHQFQSAKAYFKLGQFYESGYPCAQDLSKALKCYHAAYKLKWISAYMPYGRLNYFGIKPCLSEAFKAFSLAHEVEIPTAKTGLGLCYVQGYPDKTHLKKGIELILSSLHQFKEDNESQLKRNLGITSLDLRCVIIQLTQKDLTLIEGIDAEFFYTTAMILSAAEIAKEQQFDPIKIFKFAQKKAHPLSHYQIGLCYKYGRGGAKQHATKAIKNFKLAIEANTLQHKSVPSILELADMYMKGCKQLPVNLEVALCLYKKVLIDPIATQVEKEQSESLVKELIRLIQAEKIALDKAAEEKAWRAQHHIAILQKKLEEKAKRKAERKKQKQLTLDKAISDAKSTEIEIQTETFTLVETKIKTTTAAEIKTSTIKSQIESTLSVKSSSQPFPQFAFQKHTMAITQTSLQNLTHWPNAFKILAHMMPPDLTMRNTKLKLLYSNFTLLKDMRQTIDNTIRHIYKKMHSLSHQESDPKVIKDHTAALQTQLKKVRQTYLILKRKIKATDFMQGWHWRDFKHFSKIDVSTVAATTPSSIPYRAPIQTGNTSSAVSHYEYGKPVMVPCHIVKLPQQNPNHAPLLCYIAPLPYRIVTIQPYPIQLRSQQAISIKL